MHYRMLTLLLISMMLVGLNGTVAQATTTTVACSIRGTITITDNSVRRHNACKGIASVPAGVTSIGDSALGRMQALSPPSSSQ